ncbi:MAG: hypothetical protein RBR08_14470 [Desulforegulaceae bacterium]|nr:hypothetical protein [Desulforegulaceae bacterium]
MGSDFTWKPISGFFKEFKKYNPEIFPAPLSSPLMMNKVAEVIMKSGYDLSWMGSGLENIAAGYTFWQSQPNRTVYVAKKETASFLETVRLTFIPENPPSSWSGNTFLIETDSIASSSTLLENIGCILAYQTKDAKGELRYFFVCLFKPDGIFVFSIKADQFKINADLAKTGKLLDTEMYGDLDGFPERRLFTKGENQKALKVLQFVFAASYYIESAGKKDGVTTKHLKLGPAFESPSSEEKPGKKKKRKGKTLPVRAWTYATLSVDREVMDNKGKEQGEGRKLNTDDLTLSPVIVSPHIRRMSDDRIVLVDAYESHRWKSEEKVGKKIKI